MHTRAKTFFGIENFQRGQCSFSCWQRVWYVRPCSMFRCSYTAILQAMQFTPWSMIAQATRLSTVLVIAGPQDFSSGMKTVRAVALRSMSHTVYVPWQSRHYGCHYWSMMNAHACTDLFWRSKRFVQSGQFLATRFDTLHAFLPAAQSPPWSIKAYAARRFTAPVISDPQDLLSGMKRSSTWPTTPLPMLYCSSFLHDVLQCLRSVSWDSNVLRTKCSV